MSRHFTLPTMLRMTPNDLIQQFFGRLGHSLLCIDWLQLKDRQVEPLLSAMRSLSREAQEQIESSLASIFELSCEAGWQAILDAARQYGESEPARRFPSGTCAYARAMWTWLNRPEVFEHALLMHEVEGLPRWRKRTGLPILRPRITPATVRELGDALSHCLRREEGRGNNCTVEYYRRRESADVFVAYPDDFVRTVSHVKELLEQAVSKLKLVCHELPVGVYSAGLQRRDTRQRVIVAGIQSIYQRATDLGPFDLVIVDEAHLIPTDGDGMYRQFLTEAKSICPHQRVIGLTATPFRLAAGSICAPDHFLNAVCYEIGVKELIVGGYLCPLVTKAGIARADTSALRVRGGEFVADEVEDLMDRDALVEAACQEIVAHTAERKACLIFTSGVKHGRHVARVLQEKHSVECRFVCGDTPAGERQELLSRFRDHEERRLFSQPPLKYLCNVNVLTTGFDAPNIDCVALLRPTMSAGLYSRPASGVRAHPRLREYRPRLDSPTRSSATRRN